MKNKLLLAFVGFMVFVLVFLIKDKNHIQIPLSSIPFITPRIKFELLNELLTLKKQFNLTPVNFRPRELLVLFTQQGPIICPFNGKKTTDDQVFVQNLQIADFICQCGVIIPEKYDDIDTLIRRYSTLILKTQSFSWKKICS